VPWKIRRYKSEMVKSSGAKLPWRRRAGTMQQHGDRPLPMICMPAQATGVDKAACLAVRPVGAVDVPVQLELSRFRIHTEDAMRGRMAPDNIGIQVRQRQYCACI
jgi:hypothetical protein